MAIIKIEFDEGRWEAVPRRLAEDKRLALDTRGLALYLATRREDFTISILGLRKLLHPQAGKDRLQRMLGELADAGYLTRTRERRAGGRFDWISTFRSTGGTQQSTTSGFTGCGEPASGETVSGATACGETGHILNTKTRKTSYTKNTHTKELGGVCVDGKYEKTDNALFRDGKLIASAADYKKAIQARVAEERITEGRAWTDVQDELIDLMQKDAEREAAKKRRQGRR